MTVQLQQRKIDIAESMKQINLLKAQLRNLRKTIDQIHNKYYDQVLQLAASVGVKKACSDMQCSNHSGELSC